MNDTHKNGYPLRNHPAQILAMAGLDIAIDALAELGRELGDHWAGCDGRSPPEEVDMVGPHCWRCQIYCNADGVLFSLRVFEGLLSSDLFGSEDARRKKLVAGFRELFDRTPDPEAEEECAALRPVVADAPVEVPA